MKPIGISGYKQGGKTTLAEYLKSELEKDGHKVVIANFADELKNEFIRLFVPAEWNWGRAELDLNKDTHLDTINMTVRQGLQWFGTDVCRKKYPDVWINALKRHLHGMGNVIVIIADVRFPNEVKFCQEDGKVLRLTRRPFPDSHESETALDQLYMRTLGWYLWSDIERECHPNYFKFDHIIDNSTMTEQEKNEAALPIVKEWLK